MVAEDVPRLFAVIREYGDRVDARIAAWGMAFADHAKITGSGTWMSTESPEHAASVQARHPRSRPPHLGSTPPLRKPANPSRRDLRSDRELTAGHADDLLAAGPVTVHAS
jgi:hypothetical protein